MAEIEAVLEDKEVRDFISAVVSRSKKIQEKDRQYVGLLSAIVYGDVIDHFAKERGPNGKWKDWSDMYRQHLKKIGRSGNKILQFTGRMRQSFTPAHYKIQTNGILWFNPVGYSGLHDEGIGRYPKRQFMWLSDRAFEKISQQTVQYLAAEGR